MNYIQQIFQRIKTANAESQIAVELIEDSNKKELRSYFANCVPAPSYLIAKNIEVEKIRVAETRKPEKIKSKELSKDNKLLMMPHRNPRNQLGVFFGVQGVEKLKSILQDIGFDGGAV